MAFKVGSSKIIENKIVDGDPVTVKAGKYSSVGKIYLPKGGHYTLSHQIRLDAGMWARVKFVRVGWGKDLDGRDGTGLHRYLPDPTGEGFSETFNHSIYGGGWVDCRVKVYGPAYGAEVKLPTSIFKAYRES